MIAFWQIVWILIAVQIGIGLVITQLYYDGESAEDDRSAAIADHGEENLHG